MNSQLLTTAQGARQAHSRWLILARVVWILVVLLVSGLFVASVPLYAASLHRLCPAVSCNFDGQITAADVRTLQALGLSLHFYATFMVMFSCLFFLGYVVVSVVIFWHRSDDPIALFTSFCLVLCAFALKNVNDVGPSSATWWLSTHSINFLANYAGCLLFCLIDDHRRPASSG